MKLFFQKKEACMLKKNILVLLFTLTVSLSGQLTVAQTAADYDALSVKPGIYEGVSEAMPSEAAALLDAQKNGHRMIATAFCSWVSGRYDVKISGKGNSTDVVVATTDASVTIRLPLTGVEQVGKKIEQTQNGYIARVLLTLSKEGRLMAEKYVDRETSAFRAYRHFAGKYNLPPVVLTAVPDGYSDYSSWLENNAMILEMQSNGTTGYLVPLDAFLRKLSRTITIFADNYDGRPARIVYNTPDRFQEVITALQKNRIKVSRENARLILSPDISLDEFKREVDRMPDAGRMIIAGISTYDNRYTDMPPLVLNDAALAGQNFGIRAEVVKLPEQYLNGTYNDTQIINVLDRKTARYVLLIKSTTGLEQGIEAYGIAPYYRISYRAVLFDSLTEKTVYSDILNDVAINNNFPLQSKPNLKNILNSILENL
jgi:hypothetical protein